MFVCGKAERKKKDEKMAELLYHYRFVPVIGLLAVAALLATPPNRLPLALRGLRKMLGRPGGTEKERDRPVSALRRLLAFVLILLAFLLAVL